MLTVCAGLGLAGCSASVHVQVGSTRTTSTSTTAGVLSGAKLQNAVEQLTRHRGLAARSVSCAAGIAEAKGAVSFCTATYPGGETARFRVTQDDAAGNVTIAPAAMVSPEVENAILAHLVHPAHHGTARCPADVPIVAGRVFKCRVQAGTKRSQVRVRILDGSGLRYHVQVV